MPDVCRFSQFGMKKATIVDAALCDAAAPRAAGSIGFKFDHQEAGRSKNGVAASGTVSLLTTGVAPAGSVISSHARLALPCVPR